VSFVQVDVVTWRDQHVEVARGERTLLDELERAVPLDIDVLVLGGSVEPDEAPCEVVMDRRFRTGRDDE